MQLHKSFLLLVCSGAFLSAFGQNLDNIGYLEREVNTKVDQYFGTLNLVWDEEIGGDRDQVRQIVQPDLDSLFTIPLSEVACYNDLDPNSGSEQEFDPYISTSRYIDQLVSFYDSRITIEESNSLRAIGRPYTTDEGLRIIPVRVEKIINGYHKTQNVKVERTVPLTFNFKYDYDRNTESISAIRIYNIRPTNKSAEEFRDDYRVYRENLSSITEVTELQQIQTEIVDTYYQNLTLLSSVDSRLNNGLLKNLNAVVDDGQKGYYDLINNRVAQGSLRDYIALVGKKNVIIHVRPYFVINRYYTTYQNRRAALYEIEVHVDRKKKSEVILIAASEKKVIKTFSDMGEARRECKETNPDDGYSKTEEPHNLEVKDFPRGSKFIRGKSTLPISWSNSDDNELLTINLLKGGSQLRTIERRELSINSSGSYDWSLPKSLKSGSDYSVEIEGLTTDTNNYFTIKKRYNGVWLAVGVSAALGGGYGLYCLVTGNCKNQIETIEKPTPPCPPGFDNCN